MKRFATLLTVIAAILALAIPAGAARGDAGDFARDCNDDGIVRIDGVQKYIGGTAAITRHCNVAMSPGSLLVFRDVELKGSGGLAAISARENTTVKVLSSTIVVDGPLELTAGCCAGDAGVPEQNGTVIVKRSTLSGTSLQLLASFDWPDGRVVVRSSSLTGSGPLGVQVRASDLGGSDGLVRVVDTEITSGGDVLIRTGATGKTVARRNTFVAPGSVDITTGRGGICRSSDNRPPTACS